MIDSRPRPDLTEPGDLTNQDLATVLDALGALWDHQDHYAVLLIESLGRTRALACSLSVLGVVIEELAHQAGHDRDQVLGVVRGAVLDL